MKWKLYSTRDFTKSPIEQVLSNRGISDVNHYLNTTNEDICNYTELGVDKLKAGVGLILKTVSEDKQAVVIVDSDADGFTSSAVIINYLYHHFPTWVENKLKWLIHSGKQHGIEEHMDLIVQYKDEIGLVIAPDSSSNENDLHKELSHLGIDCLVLDHHLSDIDDTDPAVIINNQLSDYRCKHSSGAVITWQFCRYMDAVMGTHYADIYIDLAALGTCSDMMDYREYETKRLVDVGFNNIYNPFFEAMSQKNEYAMSKRGGITYNGVAWYVTPFINATVRSGTPQEKELIFKSMLSFEAIKQVHSTKRGHKQGEMETIVAQACRTVTNIKNRQGKAEKAGMELVEDRIKQNNMLDNGVLLFLLNPNEIDGNIAGLVANKLMAKYQRCVCVLTKTFEADEGLPWEEGPGETKVYYRGSARGYTGTGLDSFKNICDESNLTEFTAGHDNAFGIGIAEEDIPAFIEYTNSALDEYVTGKTYYLDFLYQNKSINPTDILEIGAAKDLWGQNVTEPYIGIQEITLDHNNINIVGLEKNKPTLRIQLDNGITLMKFNYSMEEYEELTKERTVTLNIVGTADINNWGGNTYPQIMIEQYEIVESRKWIF